MRSFFVVMGAAVVLAAVTAGSPAAMAQAYSGTTGTNNMGVTGTPPVVQTEPPTLPPVFQGTAQQPTATMPPAIPVQPVAPSMPQAANGQGGAVAPGGQLNAKDLPPDACAAFLGNYQYYAACQDREKRLERMKELKEKREADAAARRKAIEDRKKAAEDARKAQAGQPKMLRPGQKELPPKQPQQVRIVPSDDDKADSK